jgi:hypothetical protein
MRVATGPVLVLFLRLPVLACLEDQRDRIVLEADDLDAIRRDAGE